MTDLADIPTCPIPAYITRVCQSNEVSFPAVALTPRLLPPLEATSHRRKPFAWQQQATSAVANVQTTPPA